VFPRGKKRGQTPLELLRGRLKQGNIILNYLEFKILNPDLLLKIIK